MASRGLYNTSATVKVDASIESVESELFPCLECTYGRFTGIQRYLFLLNLALLLCGFSCQHLILQNCRIAQTSSRCKEFWGDHCESGYQHTLSFMASPQRPRIVFLIPSHCVGKAPIVAFSIGSIPCHFFVDLQSSILPFHTTLRLLHTPLSATLELTIIFNLTFILPIFLTLTLTFLPQNILLSPSRLLSPYLPLISNSSSPASIIFKTDSANSSLSSLILSTRASWDNYDLAVLSRYAQRVRRVMGIRPIFSPASSFVSRNIAENSSAVASDFSSFSVSSFI